MKKLNGVTTPLLSEQFADAKNTIWLKASLDAVIYKEKPGMYVSYCEALDVCSQGDTAKEAGEMIADAVELVIESYHEHGVLGERLQEFGFRPVAKSSGKRNKKSNGKNKSLKKESPEMYGTFVKKITFPAELPMLVHG